MSIFYLLREYYNYNKDMYIDICILATNSSVLLQIALGELKSETEFSR